MSASTDAAIKAALEYASLGFLVFPAKGKTGLPKDWPNVASKDEERIIATFGRFPHFENVAVKCGPESNLIDVNANGNGGVDLLRELFGGEIPITPQYSSTRGPHWWLRWREGLPSKARYFLGEDKSLEIIAGNAAAYTLAPPSVADRVARVWLPGLSPGECPLAVISDEVLARLVGGTTVAPKASSISDDGGMIAEGDRNVRLTSIAGSYRRIGWNSTAIYGALAVVNRERCQPPLPDAEVQKIAESVARYKPEEIQTDLSGWRLEIVDSDPKRYRLYSPVWPGSVSLTPNQFRRAWAIGDEVQGQKDIFLGAGFKKRWPKIASAVLRDAQHVEAKPDEVRSAVVAMAVLDFLGGARPLKEGQEPDSRGIACRLPEGGYVFAFGYLFELLRRSADQVQRPELSRLFQRIGAVDYRPTVGGKRLRLQEINPDAFEALEGEAKARSANPLI